MSNELIQSLKTTNDEEVLLVSLIQKPSLVNQLVVKPFMMSEEINAITLKAIYEVVERNLSLDVPTMINYITTSKNYDVGSLYERFKVLSNSELASSNIMTFQENIVEGYKKRMQVKALQKAMDNILVIKSDNVFHSVTGNFEAINKKADVLEKNSKRLSDISVEFIQSLQEAKPTYYKTGFKSLDALFGWQKGDLNILAARPGIGKTALGIELGMKHVQENKQAVIVFSKEMTRYDLVKRIHSSEAKIQSYKFKDSDKLELKDWERLYASLGVMSDLDFQIDDSHYMTPSYIRQKTREFISVNPDKHVLVIVDYLQLLNSENERLPRYEQVSKISNDLKAIAKELECTVLALAQLNRGNENRQDTKPKSSDIKESGSIEQDASVIIMLHRDLMSEEDRGLTEVLITKNRNGSPGTCKLKFIPEISKFVDIG